jgi:hypothetical protein
MKIVTQELQDDLKVIMDKLNLLRNESKDLYNLYWKGTVNTDNPGGTTAATTATSGSLEGNDITNSVTLADNLNNFFDNIAVGTVDYLATIEKLLHGDNAAITAISSDIEDFGARSVTFAQDLLDVYNKARDAENFYNTSEIGSAAGAMSTQTIMFGSSMTKDDLTSAITLLQQFQNMLNNTAVTTGDYKATLGKWLRL